MLVVLSVVSHVADEVDEEVVVSYVVNMVVKDLDFSVVSLAVVVLANSAVVIFVVRDVVADVVLFADAVVSYVVVVALAGGDVSRFAVLGVVHVVNSDVVDYKYALNEFGDLSASSRKTFVSELVANIAESNKEDASSCVKSARFGSLYVVQT